MAKELILKEDEEIIDEIRQYFLVYIPHLSLGILFIILSFFLLFPLFYRGWWGIMIFFLMFIVGLFIAIRTVFVWYNNYFLITNKRLIDYDQKGFFQKEVSQAPYQKIQDVSHGYKGVFQTLLKYGKIKIQTAGNSSVLEISCIKNPYKYQELIIDQIKNENQSFDMQKTVFDSAQIDFHQLEKMNESQFFDLMSQIEKIWGAKKVKKYFTNRKSQEIDEFFEK